MKKGLCKCKGLLEIQWDLHFICIVKRIAALRAEFRRIFRIRRIPTTFIALVKRLACRTFRTAPLAEITLVHRTA